MSFIKSLLIRYLCCRRRRRPRRTIRRGPPFFGEVSAKLAAAVVAGKGSFVFGNRPFLLRKASARRLVTLSAHQELRLLLSLALTERWPPGTCNRAKHASLICKRNLSLSLSCWTMDNRAALTWSASRRCVEEWAGTHAAESQKPTY